MITYLRDIVFNLLGGYTPEYVYDMNGELVGISPDVEYIVSAIIFIIAFYSFFRVVGLLCSKQ